ncbi:MAG TPA: hypothetical protein DEH78_22635 [Solibacterales bacterium]|nr:hypothetical protein [Bryobacterales bacterium]
MPDQIQTVVYFSAEIPNKVGEGAKALDALRQAGVNLTGFWGYPVGRKARLDIVPADAKDFPKIAKKAGLILTGKATGFFLNGEDRPGVVADVLAKLAAAGISARAVQAVCAGAGRYGAFLQIDPADLRKAKKALGAS